MGIITKITSIRFIICLIILNIGLVQSALAQNTLRELYPQAHYQLYQFLRTPALPELKFQNLTSVPLEITPHLLRESLQFKPSSHLSKNLLLADGIIQFDFLKTKEKVVALQSNLICRTPCNYPSPSFKYQYNPTQAIWEGLGTLLLGVSRAVLFPTASDFTDL